MYASFFLKKKSTLFVYDTPEDLLFKCYASLLLPNHVQSNHADLLREGEHYYTILALKTQSIYLHISAVIEDQNFFLHPSFLEYDTSLWCSILSRWGLPTGDFPKVWHTCRVFPPGKRESPFHVLLILFLLFFPCPTSTATATATVAYISYLWNIDAHHCFFSRLQHCLYQRCPDSSTSLCIIPTKLSLTPSASQLSFYSSNVFSKYIEK